MGIELASPWVPAALQREKGKGGMCGTGVPFLLGHRYRTARRKEGSMGLTTSWVPNALQEKRWASAKGGRWHPLLPGSPLHCWGKGGQWVPFPFGPPHSKEKRGGGRTWTNIPLRRRRRRGEYPGLAPPSPWVPNGKGWESHGDEHHPLLLAPTGRDGGQRERPGPASPGPEALLRKREWIRHLHVVQRRTGRASPLLLSPSASERET